MKRFLIAACTIAVATTLVATPSMAGARSVGSVVSAADSDPNVPYVPADDSSQDANELAQRLRDKMPFISEAPKLVGNDLVWEVDISPMRLTYKKGVSLLDRVRGTVYVSAPGVDMRYELPGASGKKPIFEKVVPSRLVTKAGAQKFRMKLPSSVAAQLRKVPKSALGSRVAVVMWNDKDIDAAHPGYDRMQMTHSNVPTKVAKYLEGRRTAVESSGWRRSAPKASLWRSLSVSLPSKNTQVTPTSLVIYNGSPFDVDVAFSSVQCNAFSAPSNQGTLVLPSSLASGASAEWWNFGQIEGNQWYEGNLETVQESAHGTSEALTEASFEALKMGSIVNHATNSFAKGLATFGASLAIGLVASGLKAAIAKAKNENEACTNAGTAMSLSWTNVGLGATQTAGNISYWVPSFNRTANMVGVPPTSVPVVAPGSPLTGYNATSQNGLAAAPQVLTKELGLGGTVTLATLNSDQQNGSYNGFWCNYSDQQTGNPNSTTSTSEYGNSSLGGGTTASWGPCVATYYQNGQDKRKGYSNKWLVEAEGFTFMIGYSTTAYNTAGPYPTTPQPTTAASAAACIATNTPCAFYTPAAGGAPATLGCTPGTWNMLTPWSTSSPTVSLSSMPSSYQASSELNMQLAYTGITASGTPGTFFAPPSIGGSITSSFSPTTVNLWQLTPANLAAVQQSLGGPGGYVTEWACVMTAATSIPSGIPPSATAMNLGWYGVPVVVPMPNPVGNVLSPPA